MFRAVLPHIPFWTALSARHALIRGLPLLCAAVVARAAHAQEADQQSSELCSIKTVAVVGDDQADQAAKDTRKRVEKKTWMKRVAVPDQADGILDVQILITSFSVSLSGDQVTSASKEGNVAMQLKRRQPEKVLWEGKQALGTGNPIDILLTSLQKEAGCRKR